jgi:hypothetical protein
MHRPYWSDERETSVVHFGLNYFRRTSTAVPGGRYARSMASIQDTYFAGMRCFGCGPANPDGLQLKSFAVEGGTVATFIAAPAHDNGLGFVTVESFRLFLTATRPRRSWSMPTRPVC